MCRGDEGGDFGVEEGEVRGEGLNVGVWVGEGCVGGVGRCYGEGEGVEKGGADGEVEGPVDEGGEGEVGG